MSGNPLKRLLVDDNESSIAEGKKKLLDEGYVVVDQVAKDSGIELVGKISDVPSRTDRQFVD